MQNPPPNLILSIIINIVKNLKSTLFDEASLEGFEIKTLHSISIFIAWKITIWNEGLRELHVDITELQKSLIKFVSDYVSLDKLF